MCLESLCMVFLLPTPCHRLLQCTLACEPFLTPKQSFLHFCLGPLHRLSSLSDIFWTHVLLWLSVTSSLSKKAFLYVQSSAELFSFLCITELHSFSLESSVINYTFKCDALISTSFLPVDWKLHSQDSARFAYNYILIASHMVAFNRSFLDSKWVGEWMDRHSS